MMKTLFSVVAAHLLLFVTALVAPKFASHKKEHKPLIVKTIVPKTSSVDKKPQGAYSPQAPKVAAAPQPKPKPQPAPQKKQEAPKTTAAKPLPAVKKEPAIADKKIVKAPPAPVKKSPPPRAKISDSLLQELEESIAKIDPKSDKGTAGKRTPASNKAFAPISLQIDALGSLSVEDGKSDYTDILVQHLHQALSLPEFGEVKIQLSLRQDGTVAKVIVLKAQSEKNKHYLEVNLPSLRFPRLDGAYASKKEHTFILTFCNEL